MIEREYTFLAWTASDGGDSVHDGAGPFHVVEGRIALHTIHYTAR